MYHCILWGPVSTTNLVPSIVAPTNVFSDLLSWLRLRGLDLRWWAKPQNSRDTGVSKPTETSICLCRAARFPFWSRSSTSISLGAICLEDDEGSEDQIKMTNVNSMGLGFSTSGPVGTLITRREAMDCGYGSISLMLNVTRIGKDCRGISRSFWEYGSSPLGVRGAPYKARTCNRVMTVETLNSKAPTFTALPLSVSLQRTYPPSRAELKDM